QHQREAVAAPPGQRVRPPQDAAQALAQLEYQPVALAPTEGLVDEAEVVEIEQCQRYVVAAASCAQLGLVDAVLEQVVVGQTGERVDVGQAPHLGAAAFGVRDVLGYAVDGGDARLCAPPATRGEVLYPDDVAALCHDPVLVGAALLLPQSTLPRRNARAVVGVHEPLEA